ncbi:transcriptional repressor [Paucibacter sp. R3-3]|uniref:Ferric uptake regulation protein n=1 Tax=Roseateles agri TaxID=3098619 RepID=A0ABU5DCV3_9BURK|nr:transcriptional repressor [Paucibacter sp. R3-3]MDY0743964.1 transcriptional repressor [Paucibacter sp. R3-3]
MLEARFRSSGLRVTGARLRILRFFQRAHQRHWSAEEIFRDLMSEPDADLGLSTVHRILMQFEQVGLLTRHQFKGSRVVYELDDRGHHDHMVCLMCGAVEEFADETIERRRNEIASMRGFELRRHALTLFGCCCRAECRAAWRSRR